MHAQVAALGKPLRACVALAGARPLLRLHSALDIKRPSLGPLPPFLWRTVVRLLVLFSRFPAALPKRLSGLLCPPSLNTPRLCVVGRAGGLAEGGLRAAIYTDGRVEAGHLRRRAGCEDKRKTDGMRHGQFDDVDVQHASN